MENFNRLMTAQEEEAAGEFPTLPMTAQEEEAAGPFPIDDEMDVTREDTGKMYRASYAEGGKCGRIANYR
jgi:hypothetical protein